MQNKTSQSKSEINSDYHSSNFEKIFGIFNYLTEYTALNLNKRKKSTESEANIEKLSSIGSRKYHITYQNGISQYIYSRMSNLF